MSGPTIQVKDLTKVYRLYAKTTDRAKEALNPLKKSYHKDFFALRDISFQVQQGETFGIIGRNGSGKSTILKILTGVTTKTSGEVEVHGKVAALLELGAGFNLEMTGMDNIYLNGTLQGFSKREIEDKMGSIIEFADIGEFIHQPVKTYSSGMFVRLAFALAINIDPDILIVDEALSVGDIYFQLKCYRKFDEFKRAGKTILFVTHDMSSLLKYCDRAMVMDDGVKLAEGTPKEMVDLYKRVVANLNRAKSDKSEVPLAVNDPIPTSPSRTVWKEQLVLNPNVIDYGDGKVEIFDYGMFDHIGKASQSILKSMPCSIRMRVRINQDVLDPIFAMTIKDIKGNEIVGTNSKIETIEVRDAKPGAEFEVRFEQNMILQGGQYFVSFGCTEFDPNGELAVHHRLYDVFSFYVVATKFVVGIFDMGIEMTVDRTR